MQPWIGVRFNPAAGLGGLLLVYPLWSLMRLTAAYQFLRRGTRELNTVLDGMATAGVLGVLKHMPGHGRALVDSHKELPIVTASDEALAVMSRMME